MQNFGITNSPSGNFTGRREGEDEECTGEGESSIRSSAGYSSLRTSDGYANGRVSIARQASGRGRRVRRKSSSRRGSLDSNLGAGKGQNQVGHGGGRAHGTLAKNPDYLSGTIELLAKTASMRGSLRGCKGKSTFRGGNHRSLYIDEEANVGAMVMDTNAFLLQEPSTVQVESILDSKIRKFNREDALRFLHKYPGVMITLLDSVMVNETKVRESLKRLRSRQSRILLHMTSERALRVPTPFLIPKSTPSPPLAQLFR